MSVCVGGGGGRGVALRRYVLCAAGRKTVGSKECGTLQKRSLASIN